MMPSIAQAANEPAERAPEAATSAEQLVEENENVEADDDQDSTLGTDASDSTSISSSIYAGYVENGRRYQVTREGEYFMPSDEKQFKCMQAAHIVYMILDHAAPNPFFRAPVGGNVENILDIGTGDGTWAREVADRFPGVDDALKPWILQHKQDLIHIRDLQGSFSDRQWTSVYKQAYENLLPGGWIEQIDASVGCYSDDNTLSPTSFLARSGAMFEEAAAKAGKGLDSVFKTRARIEEAGFVNVQEKLYKVPLGDWAKNEVLKEAGRFCKVQLLSGLEGYTLYLFTKFGSPAPWSAEEVQVFLAKLRAEVEEKRVHAYYLKRRVWGQKPLYVEVKA